MILDESVSRSHAQIIFRNNNFYLKDVGSTTGTYIKISNRLRLVVGMILEIGSYQFIVNEIYIAPKGVLEKDPSAKKSHIILEIYDSPEDGEKKCFTIYESGSIGRKLNNHIPFVDDLHMSNSHCNISLVNNQYLLEDLSSTNG